MALINNVEDDVDLDWDPAFELGHGTIDAEHRTLHGLIVDFQEAAMRNASKDKLVRILDDVIKYAAIHFASEEKIMADCRYPKVGEHANLHHELLIEAQEIREQFRQDNVEFTHMYEFLLNWFAFHTSHNDREFVAYLNQRQD